MPNIPIFLMTNDVELFSFEHNRYEKTVAKRVLKQGLPRLLDLYDNYDINATFFYTGDIVELEPEVIDIVKQRGNHEIGCHGYSHELEFAFDTMTLKQQVHQLKKAKEIIEKQSNDKIISFRAPAARINGDTIKALERTGFKIDSSVCSQRFDGPFTFGAKHKLGWLSAPRLPYHPSKQNPFKKGNSKILEIPPSAFLLGYTGTMTRISPNLTNILGKYLISESKKKSKPVVFIIHPNEAISLESKNIKSYTRGKTLIQKIFADKIRSNIKRKNLGKNVLIQLDNILKNLKKKEVKYLTLNSYANSIGE